MVSVNMGLTVKIFLLLGILSLIVTAQQLAAGNSFIGIIAMMVTGTFFALGYYLWEMGG